MPRKKTSFLSDLVRDARIETEFLGSCIQHVFHETGRVAGERRSRKEERWVRERFLGQGSYGTVYLEKLETEPSELRAVKEIKKFVIPGQELDYTRELEAIMKFSHPNYQHCFVTSRGWFDFGDSVYITMDFHQLGDLQSHLEQPLPEFEARQIAVQVREGLGLMHENGFIHRDLKPANIMVVTKRPKWWVKIADFGISKRRQHGVTTMFTLQRGTFGFAAPEAIIADDPNETYTFSVDMWSLGAVVYKMLTNCTAFPSIASLLDFSRGALPFPTLKLTEHRVSDDGQDFIMKLMEARPDARLTAASAEQHPWITNILSITAESEITSRTMEEGDMNQETTNMSMASRAWSTDDLTVAPATCIKQSNYQPPSATDSLDETHDIKGPTFPAHPDYPLLDVFSDPREVSSLDLDHTSPEAQLTRETTRRMQESFQDRPISDSDEGKSLNEPLELSSDGDASRRAEDGVLGLSSAVAQVLDIERTTHLQDSQDEPYSSSSEDEYSEFYAGSEVEPSQTGDIESVFTVPSSNFDNLANDKTGTTDKTQRMAGDDGPKPDNEPQGRVVVCDNCEKAFSYSSYPIETLACGHLMCHSCLIRLISLALVSPKHMPPRCCESEAGKIGLQQFSRLILNPDIDSMISKIRSLKHGWKCPRGHPPKNGALLTTTGQTPIWKETVNCSACLTQTWDSKRAKSSTDTVASEFCLLCSSEIGSGESCDCWTIWNSIEKILSIDDSKLSWTDAALQRAYNTRIKMKSGAKIRYQTLEKATRSLAPSQTADMDSGGMSKPDAEVNQPGDDCTTEDDEEEDLESEDDSYDSQLEDEEDVGHFTDDDLEDDLDDDEDYPNPDNYLHYGRATGYVPRSPSRQPRIRERYIEKPDVESSWHVPVNANQRHVYNPQEPTYFAYPQPPTDLRTRPSRGFWPDCECPSPMTSLSPGDLRYCLSCGRRLGPARQPNAAIPRRVGIRSGSRTSSRMPPEEPTNVISSFAERCPPHPLTSENLRYKWAPRTVAKVESDRLAYLNGVTNSEAILEGARVEEVIKWQLEVAHPLTRRAGRSPHS